MALHPLGDDVRPSAHRGDSRPDELQNIAQDIAMGAMPQ